MPVPVLVGGTFRRDALPMKTALQVLLLAVLAAGCDHRPAPRPAASSAPASAARTAHDHTAAGLDYVERVTGGARAQARLPLIVALHGLGDRPRSFVHLFDGLDTQARVIVLRAPLPFHGGYSWFAMGDDATLAVGIRQAAQRVERAMMELEKRRPTLGRPIVTGFSQGGMLSFAIAALYPTRIAAAYPMGGMLPAPLRPAKRPAARLPEIIAMHGEADPRVPIGKSRSAVAALQALGYSAELEPFPGVGHAVPYAMRHELFGLLDAACARERSAAR